ncbi:MAG TPA: xanthine dehydrogenase family protein subunit M [Candidatus Angelobacter sp.]|nr:xanthine dehydrogenase family protein subunit M [Candidatus Angelobacter sp.]
MPNAVEPPSESPTSLADAYVLLADGGAAPWRPIAGGTDLMVQISGELGEPPARILDLWRLDELRGIELQDDALVIGALTTYTDLRRSPEVARLVPVLAEASSTIGAAQIQNRGTLGGNAVNASPAGDTLPVLLALDAELVLGSTSGERTVPASEFWPGYRTTARRPDELLVRIRVPVRPGREARFRKIGTRRAQAISKVVMALAWQAEPDGVWRNVRVALGSVAATPVRAAAAEASLEGTRPTREAADAVVAALLAEINPIDDVRSTADYRRAVAGRALHRLIRDAGGW